VQRYKDLFNKKAKGYKIKNNAPYKKSPCTGAD